MYTYACMSCMHWLEDRLLTTYTVATCMHFVLIFEGFIFCGFSIFADFALLNLRMHMLAIVPCVTDDP